MTVPSPPDGACLHRKSGGFRLRPDVDEETKRKMELLYSSERILAGLYNRRNIEEKVTQALNHEDSLSCLDDAGFRWI